MNDQSIFEKVQKAISISCGIEEEKITMDATLFDDLAITSIDLVDILYYLESEFNVELKISDIEKESRKDLGNAPFEINNVLTAEGLEVLKKKLPEIPSAKIKPGLTTYDIINLITVKILCNMITMKLEQIENGKG